MPDYWQHERFGVHYEHLTTDPNKTTIALDLDTAQGVFDGGALLAGAAMNAGAMKEEITEVIRVAQYTTGVGSVYDASIALKDFA